MGKRSGITTEALKNIIVDNAVVYVDYDLPNERVLGVTKGGSSFSVEREYRVMELDGIEDIQVKGAKRIISENAFINCSLAEMSPENIQIALAGSDIDETDIEYDIITSRGQINNDDYMENVALVGTLSGTVKPIVCIIENVLGDGEFELATEDNDESAVDIQLSAHFDPEDMTRVPWEIRYPKIEETPIP